MSEDFKSNFITADVDKPMLELEELNNLVKKKKAEVRKAMFYAKHPDLLQAKKDYEAKMASVNTEKFNEAIAEGKKEVKEEPKQVAPETVQVQVQATIPAPVTIQKPMVQTTVPMSMPVPQHSRPLVVGLNAKWF